MSTEGPRGLAARRWCLKTGFPFTTAYHTRCPDYVAVRMAVSPSLVWRFIRWFHRPARHITVATPSLRQEPRDEGLEMTLPWEAGEDHALVRPPRDPTPGSTGRASRQERGRPNGTNRGV